MKKVIAIVSLLHERPDQGSMIRRFRARPVLAWTLSRLHQAQRIDQTVVLCWQDQHQAAQAIAAEQNAQAFAPSARQCVPSLDALTAARKFADGWRGGLFGTCDFDLGFYGPLTLLAARQHQADAVVLVRPDAGLVDPALIDGLVDHARSHLDQHRIFSQAAPGLSGVLLTVNLLENLAAARQHPGRTVCYQPAQPAPDPISGDGCAPVPTPLARTTHRYTLDSDRQISLLDRATACLNGQLPQSSAAQLVDLVNRTPINPRPREVEIELTTRRLTRAIYRNQTYAPADRPDMTLQSVGRLFDQLSRWDDVRLSLLGAGDALLHPQAPDIIARAREVGLNAIHIETDGVDIPLQTTRALVDCGVDIVSVHLPATSAATYTAMMGIDALHPTIEWIKTFVQYRHDRGQGVPLIVPTFVKCAANLHEMEEWYDQWLGALGSAVIAAPPERCGPAARVAVGAGRPNSTVALHDQSVMRIRCDGQIQWDGQTVAAGDAIDLEQAWRQMLAARASSPSDGSAHLHCPNNPKAH